MELGVDIGDLDATILSSYPGSVASTWQQASRSGRSGERSLSVLVANDDPLDQYLMRHPDAFFGRPHEAARISPGNPYILKPHLLCAAYEAPITLDDVEFFGEELITWADELIRDELLSPRSGHWHLNPKVSYPAQDVNIRSTSANFYTLVEGDSGVILETVEEASAFLQLHPGAVYLHQGEPYLITDLDSRTAYAVPTDVPYYTEVRDLTETRVLKVYKRKAVAATTVYLGEVNVSTSVVGFRRRVRITREVLGEEYVDLPTQSYDTVGVWFDIPEDTVRHIRAQRLDLAGGLHAVEHAAIGVLPLYALCNRNDIGGISTPVHPSYGASAGLYTRRPPRRRRNLRARLRHHGAAVGGDAGRHSGVRLWVGVPGLHPVTQMRQQQPAPRQGGRQAGATGYPGRARPSRCRREHLSAFVDTCVGSVLDSSRI